MSDCVQGKTMAECKSFDTVIFDDINFSADFGECKIDGKTEKFCEPCQEEHKILKANGFCVDCQHYLCEACYDCHCRPKPMRHHRLLDKASMPGKKVSEDLSEMCKKHEGETIKYYCKQHETVGCNSCMLLEHKPCGDLCTLTEAAIGVIESQPYTDLCDEIREIENILEKQKEKAEENVKKSKLQYVVATEKIESLQKSINEHFDKLREYIKDEAKNTLETDTEKMEKVQKNVNLVKNKQKKLKEDLEILEETNQNKQLFIAISKSKKQVESLKQSITDIVRDNDVKTYEFKETDHIRNIFENVSEIGVLLNKNEDNQFENTFSNTLLDRYEEFGISKSSTLGQNYAAIIYPQQNRVQIVYNGQIYATKILNSSPWDICTINPNTFAVTLPNEGKISVFSTGMNQILERQEILVQAQCEGIHYREKFFVACSVPAKILVLQANGECIKTITADGTDHQYFTQPAYIYFDALKQHIIITDRETEEVIAFSIDGNFLGVCESSQFQLPLRTVSTVFHLNLSRIN